MAAKSEKSVEKSVVETKAAATRERELDAAISSITKAYGDGAIMRLGDARAQVSFRPADWRLTSHSASVVCRAGASWKFTARNPPAKPL
jgi:hypothetical protein